MRSFSIGLAAAVLAGCVAGNPGGGGDPRTDAGPGELVLEGGSFMLTQCGYPVVSRFGASAPVLGTPVLGDDAAPYHIHLGLAGPPKTSMVVQWATRDQTTLATTVQYGKKSGAGITEATQEGVTYVFGTGFSGNGPLVRVHETHLCGLEPNTVYTYRVGGVGADGAEKWSAPHDFRTAPDVTTDDPEIKVLVLGDTRDGYDIWGRLLKQDALAYSPDLILFTGDAVTFGAIQEEWDAYFDAAEGVLESVPMVAAHGNHDTNSVNFFSLFAMPGNEQVFSLDYGAFHLTMLNDSPEKEEDIAGKERDFLDADLAAHADAPWKIVMHHKPLWSAAGNHGSDPVLQAQWGPLYDQYHVDLVVNGHDHNYERSHPMFGNQVKATPAEGTVYLVAGSAGAELYDNGTGFWTAYSEKTQNSAVLTIRKKLLRLDAYRADGTAMESFSIDKGTP
jgi:predicted phosphodiesterase